MTDNDSASEVPWTWDSSIRRLPSNDEELDSSVERYFRDDAALAEAHRTNEAEAVEDRGLYDVAGYDGWPNQLLTQVIVFEGRPEEAWPIVVQLVERAPTEEALALVAAGPLENIVQYHSDAFADRLVERARESAKWREALLGVWGGEKSRKRSDVGSMPYWRFQPVWSCDNRLL